METKKKKINPYFIVIIVLVLTVSVFAYDKWGDNLLPASVKEADKLSAKVKTLKEDIQIGNDKASVTIVEYFSYFCGYCKLFKENTEPKIIEDYVSAGKVRLILRPFPPFETGLAVLCANDQNKFFEYHNALFDKIEEIQEANDLKVIAKNLGLNVGQFNECFDSQKHLTKVQEWYNQGQKDFEGAGVPENQRGTPAFFVNGEAFIGAHPYDAFIEIIERKLNE